MKDFKSLANKLISSLPNLLSIWLPGGKVIGTNYVCASIQGGQGESFKVSLDSGVWKDFAKENVSGGDPISLYAAIKGLTQIQAYNELAGEEQLVFKVAPKDTLPPNFSNSSKSWRYQTKEGDTYFYVCRFDKDGKKFFSPYSYTNRGEWVKKGWKNSVPLYNQNKWKGTCNNFFIVEGEKCADIAQEIASKHYNVTTWSMGASAFNKSNWQSLSKAKKVLLWPDNDEPGIKAMQGIAQIIYNLNPSCDIKIISTHDMKDKQDIADLYNEGLDSWEIFLSFIKDRARPFVPTIAEPVKSKAELLPAPTPQGLPEKKAPSYPTSWIEDWAQVGIPLSSTGKPILNESSIANVLTNFLPIALDIWTDTFKYQQLITYRNLKGQTIGPEEYSAKRHSYDICAILQRALNLDKLTALKVDAAIQYLGFEKKKSAPKEWLETLSWDGSNRLDTFFQDYCGAEDSEYTRAVSKNFWIGLVARIMKPGCQLDTMVIMEGNDQGKGKTTLLRTIASDEYYACAKTNLQDKDFYQVMQGCIIIEMGELATLKKSDTDMLKDMLTITRDKFRAPYEARPMTYLRQSIFVGTTNEDFYLNDSTGGRRFLPIQTKGIIKNPEVKRDRDQLFAEAVYRFKQGETWHEVPESAKEVQESRRSIDPMEKIIEDILRKQFPFEDHVSVNQIIDTFQDLRTTDKSRNLALRIGKCLRSLKWVVVDTPRKINGRSYRVFQKPYNWNNVNSIESEDSIGF